MDMLRGSQSAQKLLRANRLYAVLSRVGEAVVRLADRQQLFDEVCRIAIEHGLFRLAWIGLVDEAEQVVRPVAYSGTASNYLNSIRISYRDEPAGQGPTGAAVREGRPVLCNDFANDPRTRPWHDLGAMYGFRSSAAFPIKLDERPVAALSLYAGEHGFFDDEETALVERVTATLSFALEKLAQEEQRKQAEASLRLDTSRQEALLRLSEMGAASEQEIVEFALEEAVRLTDSTIGYLHFINSNQVSLQLFTWSRGVREECYAETNTHYPLADAGVWVDCVRWKRPVFHNDYQNLPERRGYPPGHIHLVRHMSVPLLEGDKVVAVAGVGNKAGHYGEHDARQLLLFMSGMWTLLQRKRAEEALRESEKRYRRLTENAPDLIYRIELHPARRFTYVSPAATAIVGYTPEDHYADPDLGMKLVHPDDQPLLLALASGEIPLDAPIELRWRHKDGSLIWVEQRNVPIFDADGTLVAIEGIARDITARKQAAEAYTSLVEHSLQGLIIYQDGRIVFANAMMSEISGYSIDELLALSPEQVFGLVYPDDRPMVLNFLQGRLAGAELPSRYEYRISRKDGTVRWLEARGVRIMYRGQPALQGAFVDITERKQTEQVLAAERAQMEATIVERTRELRRERDRTRAILEALGEAVMVVDTEGNIIYRNPAASAVTSFKDSEGAGSAASAWFWQYVESHTHRATIQAALAAGLLWRGEVVLRRGDGARYDAAVTIAPLFSPDDPGQPAGFVSIQRDITALKVAERMKDQFVSNVSHELRTPMSLITLLVGSLEMLYPRLNDARRLEVIGAIRKHARVLSDLIGDVLEISRIDSGRTTSEQAPLDLAQLARHEVAQQLPMARKKDLAMVIEADEPLPVMGSAGQLQQVIRNLISNAIKYTPDGGRVTCTCRVVGEACSAGNGGDHGPGANGWPGLDRLPSGRWAALRVSDSGIGIGEADLPHIFERFYRAQTQGDIPGTGLGLSIAWELVRLHAGYLEVSSAINKGSSFVMYLPLSEVPV